MPASPPQPNAATPAIVFDHIENRATLMPTDVAVQVVVNPPQTAATSGIPKQA